MNRIFWLFLFFFSASAASSNPAIKGVFGEDNRRILQEHETIGKAIGRVNIAGYKRKALCTGTLIAPDRVITAGHCLFDPKRKRQVPTDIIHFVAGKRHTSFTAHSKVKAVRFLDGFSYSVTRTPEFLMRDIAVLHLKESLPITPITIASPLENQDSLLSHVLYSRDRPHLPAIHEGCQVLQQSKTLWRTDCDTNFGGSGGPVLTEENGKPVLAAVMVGIDPKKASFAVPVSVWRAFANQ